MSKPPQVPSYVPADRVEFLDSREMDKWLGDVGRQEHVYDPEPGHYDQVVWLDDGNEFCIADSNGQEIHIAPETIVAVLRLLKRGYPDLFRHVALSCYGSRGPVCADCDEPYSSDRFVDLIIDDVAWRAISPDGEGNGLLCPNCIVARLQRAGLSGVSSSWRSGPLAQQEPNRE